MADKYATCFGIVKGKMPAKGTWPFMAKDYETAIRHAKRIAESNLRDDYRQTTLFYDGKAVGWVFRSGGAMVYVSKYVLTDIGLMPKRK